MKATPLLQKKKDPTLSSRSPYRHKRLALVVVRAAVAAPLFSSPGHKGALVPGTAFFFQSSLTGLSRSLLLLLVRETHLVLWYLSAPERHHSIPRFSLPRPPVPVATKAQPTHSSLAPNRGAGRELVANERREGA